MDNSFSLRLAKFYPLVPILKILNLLNSAQIRRIDFNRKKKEYYYNFIYQQDGIGKPAQIIGEALSVGIKLEDLENWDQGINKLSIEKVNEALNRFLENKNFVTGMLK